MAVYKAKSASWKAANKPHLKKMREREEFALKARARTKRWSRANPEKKRASDLKFNAENKALVTSYKAKRRARVRQATPPWLDREMEILIRAIYAQAEQVSVSTGVAHHVDHIVPLVGKTVCGLHVPWNLRVMEGVENNRRPRIWSPDDLANSREPVEGPESNSLQASE